MQYVIFILELIVIIFYVDTTYGTSNSKLIELETEEYSSYYSIDVVNNTILTLDDLPENLKMTIWKTSPTQMEVLNCFPNMYQMSEVYKDRIEDNGLFKNKFLNYMEELQSQYIAGNISEEEFKELFLSPSF